MNALKLFLAALLVGISAVTSTTMPSMATELTKSCLPQSGDRNMDYSGCNLAGMSIPGNLSSDSFRDANLAGSHFTIGGGGPSDYQGVDFSGANLAGASFTGKWIQGTPTAIESALFAGANLSSAAFISVDISNCNFTNSTMNGVAFEQSEIFGSNFQNARVTFSSSSLVSQGQNFGVPVVTNPYKFAKDSLFNGEFVWSPSSVTPRVKGLRKVGGLLTATLGSHQLEGSPTYQWLKDGTPIPGPQTHVLILTPETVGHGISVAIRGTDAQYGVTEAVSSPTAPVLAANVTNGKPFKIIGTAAYGKTLTANPTLLLAGAALSYKWFVDGKLIPTAKSSSWKVSQSAIGKSVTVKVTESLNGYGSYSYTSVPIRIR